MGEPDAAAVAGMVQISDVGDEVVNLRRRESSGPELRHLPRTDPDRLRNLDRRGGVQRRGGAGVEGATLAGPRVARGAALSVQLAARCRVASADVRYGRSAVGD